jgi:hypothetical protein
MFSFFNHHIGEDYQIIRKKANRQKPRGESSKAPELPGK